MRRLPLARAALNRSPHQLDHARRAWLSNLGREHATGRSAATALALARGEWMCGEYDLALIHFTEARDLDPTDPGTHIALVRAASMLGLGSVEEAALTAAIGGHPDHPDLLVHAALRQVPGDIGAARRLLQTSRAHPMCAQFDAALAAIETATLPTLQGDDARQQAQLDSLRWAMRHASDIDVHTGLSAPVLQRALAACPGDGLTLECGVYFGRSLRIIAAATQGAVHGFDSFQGLPEAWNAAEGPGAYSTAGRLPHVADNVTLHAGWFEETLPAFFASHAEPIRLLHIDCDLYSSTRTVLEHAGPHLIRGSVLVFDDFLGYPGYELHELRAFEEFATGRDLGWELLAACLMGREVAIRITSC